eukprot:5859855-Pleurochrysis_carterae.AAC.1
MNVSNGVKHAFCCAATARVIREPVVAATSFRTLALSARAACPWSVAEASAAASWAAEGAVSEASAAASSAAEGA